MSTITVNEMLPGEIPQVANTLRHAFVTQPNTISMCCRSDESARLSIETIFAAAKPSRRISFDGVLVNADVGLRANDE